jgi:hypothetical protein
MFDTLTQQKHVQLGKKYLTTYLREYVIVMVVRIIPDSHEQRGSNNLACECIIDGTNTRLLRRIGDLENV